MRPLAICAVVAVVVTAMPSGAAAQTPSVAETISPSVSPTPGPGAGRRPSPGFVLLLVALLLGFVWQAQRVRRSTAAASERALADFERRVSPDDGPPRDGPV